MIIIMICLLQLSSLGPGPGHSLRLFSKTQFLSQKDQS